MKKTTLADNLPECSAAAAGFGDFFSGLLETTAAKTIDDALGQQIRAYVLGWLQTHPLTAFDDYSDTAYRRTYLGRCPATGWEAIVMSWKNGNRTSIHAHPQFAGYHIADGTFRLEIFEPAAGGAARLTESAGAMQVLCKGVYASLDGLKQQGCNGLVTQAHKELQEMLFGK